MNPYIIHDMVLQFPVSFPHKHQQGSLDQTFGAANLHDSSLEDCELVRLLVVGSSHLEISSQKKRFPPAISRNASRVPYNAGGPAPSNYLEKNKSVCIYIYMRRCVHVYAEEGLIV